MPGCFVLTPIPIPPSGTGGELVEQLRIGEASRADVHALLGEPNHLGIIPPRRWELVCDPDPRVDLRTQAEEAEGELRGRRGEADDVGVEILQHLAPELVDRAVALVSDDEVERLDRDRGVVGDRAFSFDRADCALEGRNLFGGWVVLFFAARHRIEALDGGDAHLGVRIDAVGLQVLDVVEGREVAAVVGRREGLELAQSLVAEIVAIDQEQDAPGAGVLDQSVAEVAGGEDLAAAGRHLDQGAGMIGGERALEVLDPLNLAAAQPLGDEGRQLLQAATQRRALREPLGERLGPVEGAHRPRSWLRVAQIAEQGITPLLS